MQIAFAKEMKCSETGIKQQELAVDIHLELACSFLSLSQRFNCFWHICRNAFLLHTVFIPVSLLAASLLLG